MFAQYWTSKFQDQSAFITKRVMLFLKKCFPFVINALFIISPLVRQSYQQTTLTTKTSSKDLEFCIQKHTMSNTLQTFWHDANSDCELETKRLIELYSQMLERAYTPEDQCAALLKHQIRKKLIQTLSVQLEDALVVQSIKTNTELKQNLKAIQEIDKKVCQIIWERVIGEVYLFVEFEELANGITLIKEPQLQIAALHSLLNKYLDCNGQRSETIMPLLTFRIHNLFKNKNTLVSLDKSLSYLYRRLPQQLRFLYDSAGQQIGLLNYHHYEYLYAPRDNGPDAERRIPLTWIKSKNSTDSDGHLLASFNERGLVAFASRFGNSPKYLYADSEFQAPYFWIGAGLKSSQWWHVLWPHDTILIEGTGYVKFQNEETKDLLCATTEYDENRRFVTLLNGLQNIENPACFWLINRF